MTIGLTYNDDLSRVQIALSGLPDGAVQVQRVINPAATEALWARGVVRGGLALPIDGGVGDLDDFEFPADVANHYRVLPVDPPAGLLLDGTAGGYASTPDAAALDIVGDVVLTASCKPTVWPPGSQQSLVSRYRTGDNQRSARLFLRDTGLVTFAWSVDGTNATTSNIDSTVAPVPDQDTGELHLRAWLDVDFNGTEHRVLFWTAPSPDGPWTTLGNTVTGVGTTSVHQGSAPLEVGSVNEGAVEVFAGTVMSAHVFAGNIAGGELGTGTVVADPDFAAQPHGTTGFTDSAGRVWTVNGTAQIVGALLEQDSITPSLGGQVWLKSIRYPALNRPVRLLDYGDPINRDSRSHVHPIAGQSPGVGMHDQRLGRLFTVHLMTQGPDHLVEAGEWDIILTAATAWFIHTPAASNVPGGYVAVGETSQRAVHRGTESPVIFRLPCTVEKAPPPQFTGTLLTAETVFRLYGSANALYAAHATGRSLLATIADPSDVVVI